MLHAMVMGFLPFAQQNRNELEKAICEENLDYAYLRRLRTTSIKNDRRRQTNCRLRMVSEDCIDLILKMLEKDPAKRIEMIEVFEHPWVVKQKHPISSSSVLDPDSDSESEAESSQSL